MHTSDASVPFFLSQVVTPCLVGFTCPGRVLAQTDQVARATLQYATGSLYSIRNSLGWMGR